MFLNCRRSDIPTASDPAVHTEIMFTLLFSHTQIKDVMSSVPKRHQTLLFSATMPKEIEALAQVYLNKPVTVKVRDDFVSGTQAYMHSNAHTLDL